MDGCTSQSKFGPTNFMHCRYHTFLIGINGVLGSCRPSPVHTSCLYHIVQLLKHNTNVSVNVRYTFKHDAYLLGVNICQSFKCDRRPWKPKPCIVPSYFNHHFCEFCIVYIYIYTRRIHVWYIYLHLVDLYGKCTINIPYMDPISNN